MLSQLLVNQNPEFQKEAAIKLLSEKGYSQNHPDLLWVEPKEGKSLGVEDTKKIRAHLSLKPYQAKGRAVVVIEADRLSLDAQNSLLKTLEEPPEHTIIILTAKSDDNLLPTILSRCQIIYEDKPKGEATRSENEGYQLVQELLNSPLEKRFQIIEKTEQKEELLESLAEYIHQKLPENPKLLDFAKSVIEAQKWQKSQGNIRAILEYLMMNLG